MKSESPSGQPDNSQSSNPQGRSTDYQKNHLQRAGNRAINNATYFGPKTVVNPPQKLTDAQKNPDLKFSAYSTANGPAKQTPDQKTSQE